MQKITIKELAIKLNISVSSAQRLARDIKQEYDIKILCYSHVMNYLKIPTPQNVS